MEANNFIIINMFSRLKFDLKGNDLIIYSLIYNFTKNGETYNTNYRQMELWTGASEPTIARSLSNLTSKNLIIKVAKGIYKANLNLTPKLAHEEAYYKPTAVKKNNTYKNSSYKKKNDEPEWLENFVDNIENGVERL